MIIMVFLDPSTDPSLSQGIVLETLKSQKNTETHKNKDPYEKKHLCRDSKDENLTYGDDCLACEGQPPLGGPR